jgi:hypothetical protein
MDYLRNAMDRLAGWRWGTVVALTILAATGSAQAAARTPPKGSYQASCTAIVFSNAGILAAQCKDTSGRTTPTSLRMPTCGKGDIANLNGKLTCPPLFTPKKKPTRPLRPTVPVALVGSASLTLYDDIDYKGPALELATDTPNMDLLKFNDRVSSVRVHGGQWQFCVDWQYKGHCSIIDKDSPNLTRFGLNNRVSSIRRVR